jgi:hypothetical protein
MLVIYLLLVLTYEVLLLEILVEPQLQLEEPARDELNYIHIQLMLEE